MKKIAIIPARGGSKRILSKNIKEFLGKPILAYSIEAALNSGLFDEVMVSTDSEEIAAISVSLGAKVPFLRSEETAGDFATTVQVLEEVILNYNRLNQTFEFGCCIYPTAPLIQISKLTEAFSLLQAKQFDTVFPIIKYSYPIWRSLKLSDGKIAMNWPENLNARSQDLPAAYHDAGQFYWFQSAALLKNKSLFCDNAGAIVLDAMHVQDIDTITDWQLAELKFRILHNIELEA